PIIHNPLWRRRYTTYVPGLKHIDENTWETSPASRKTLLADPNVNSIIPGGGTFVIACIRRGDAWHPGVEEVWPEWDVQFIHEEVPGIPNPWNELVSYALKEGIPFPIHGNRGNFCA